MKMHRTEFMEHNFEQVLDCNMDVNQTRGLPSPFSIIVFEVFTNKLFTDISKKEEANFKCKLASFLV